MPSVPDIASENGSDIESGTGGSGTESVNNMGSLGISKTNGKSTSNGRRVTSATSVTSIVSESFRRKPSALNKRDNFIKIAKKFTMLTTIGAGSTFISMVLVGIFSLPVVWYV